MRHQRAIASWLVFTDIRSTWFWFQTKGQSKKNIWATMRWGLVFNFDFVIKKNWKFFASSKKLFFNWTVKNPLQFESTKVRLPRITSHTQRLVTLFITRHILHSNLCSIIFNLGDRIDWSFSIKHFLLKPAKIYKLLSVRITRDPGLITLLLIWAFSFEWQSAH